MSIKLTFQTHIFYYWDDDSAEDWEGAEIDESSEDWDDVEHKSTL